MENKYPIVEITWFDAQSSMENWFIEEIKDNLEPLKSKSIGYLIHETDTYIVLGFLLFSNEMVKHHQVIPKGMIVERKVIRNLHNTQDIDEYFEDFFEEEKRTDHILLTEKMTAEEIRELLLKHMSPNVQCVDNPVHLIQKNLNLGHIVILDTKNKSYDIANRIQSRRYP